jgi:hypothetical protein
MRALCLLLCVVAGSAAADQNDFRIYKLGNPDPNGGTNAIPSANGNFRVFARQFAAAISSVTLMPPETLGHAGFAFSAEVSIVPIAEDPTGTKGITMPTQAAAPCDAPDNCMAGGGYKNGMASPLLIPSVHVRKGLPYSLELGGRLGWIQNSRMFVGMLELKWALNEGFTYLPDISVGGRIAKLINSRDFDLTTGGLDVSIGKQFALGGMLTLTPYVGWNLMFVGATTNPVDFNPGRSLGAAEQPANQFNDIYVFDSLPSSANTHNRFYGGLRFVSKPFMLGIEGSYTIIGSFTEAATGNNRQVPAVPAFNLMIGVDV